MHHDVGLVHLGSIPQDADDIDGLTDSEAELRRNI